MVIGIVAGLLWGYNERSRRTILHFMETGLARMEMISKSIYWKIPENTMSDTMKSTVKIDEQGRIYLPKKLRDTIKERVFKVKQEKGKLIFEPVHVAQEGRGIFKVETPIRDIDEKIEKYTREAVRDELH